MQLYSVIYYQMSRNHSSMESESSTSPKTKQVNRIQESDSSSQDEDSSEIQVHITSRLNQIKRQSSSLRKFEQQVFELKKQNIELKNENSKLLQIINHNRQDRNLKKKLQQKQKEIQELKRQVSESNYYQSSRNSKHQSAIRVDIEDRKYKLRSRSIKSKHKHKQSMNSSAEDDSQSVKLAVFDHTTELNRLKTEKLTLEKHFYQIQEKMLILEHEVKWMNNFVVKLINFTAKISYVFKQEIYHADWSLLKKAKSSWRYLKHIIKYVLQIK